MDLSRLADIGKDAAYAAGKIIRKHVGKDIKVNKKNGQTSTASEVVTAVDKECEQVILSYLLPTCAELDIALLSEETEDDGGRLKKDFFWCG